VGACERVERMSCTRRGTTRIAAESVDPLRGKSGFLGHHAQQFFCPPLRNHSFPTRAKDRRAVPECSGARNVAVVAEAVTSRQPADGYPHPTSSGEAGVPRVNAACNAATGDGSPRTPRCASISASALAFTLNSGCSPQSPVAAVMGPPDPDSAPTDESPLEPAEQPTSTAHQRLVNAIGARAKMPTYRPLERTRAA